MTALLKKPTITETPTPSLTATVDQPKLHKALALIRRAAGGRTTMPVLNNVLLAAALNDGEDGEDGNLAKPGILTLTASNLEIALSASVPASHVQRGTTTVPARLFGDFVAKLPRSETRLEQTSGHGLKVTCEHSTATLRGIEPEKFPPVPEAPEAPILTLPAAVLKRVLTLTDYAIAKDGSRPVLATLHLQADGRQHLTAQAADGFRLARYQVELPKAVAALDVLLPRGAAVELARLLPDAGDVAVSVLGPKGHANQLVFRVPGDIPVTLVARLSEGQFPDLQRVIPGETSTNVTVERAALLAAVERVAPFARDAADVVWLDIQPSGSDVMASTLVLTGATADVGDGREELPCTVGGSEGVAVAVAFSSVYLKDVLSACDGDEIQLGINGPVSPVKVEQMGLAGWVSVLMPIHQLRDW